MSIGPIFLPINTWLNITGIRLLSPLYLVMCFVVQISVGPNPSPIISQNRSPIIISEFKLLIILFILVYSQWSNIGSQKSNPGTSTGGFWPTCASTSLAISKVQARRPLAWSSILRTFCKNNGQGNIIREFNTFLNILCVGKSIENR